MHILIIISWSLFLRKTQMTLDYYVIVTSWRAT